MKRFYKVEQVETFEIKAFKAARKKAKISAAALAKAAGVSPAYLCDLEAGRRGILPETAEKLISALERLGG